MSLLLCYIGQWHLLPTQTYIIIKYSLILHLTLKLTAVGAHNEPCWEHSNILTVAIHNMCHHLTFSTDHVAVVWILFQKDAVQTYKGWIEQKNTELTKKSTVTMVYGLLSRRDTMVSYFPPKIGTSAIVRAFSIDCQIKGAHRFYT